MSSSRILHFNLLGEGFRHMVASSRVKINGTLLTKRRPSATHYYCTRPLHGQASEQYSDQSQKDETFTKAKRDLSHRIKNVQKKFKIVSLPNIITTSRALTAPAMGYFIMNNMHSCALVCCAYAAVSDVADKAIAHLTNQRSPLNTTMDALADKLFILTSFIALYKIDFISIYLLKSVVIRDFVSVAGGATIRYLGFEEKPTVKKFLDFNNYPTLCFKVIFLNQLVTGLQYSIIMAHLAFNHLTGDPIHDWGIFILQGFSMALTSTSIAWYLVNFMKPGFLCGPPKRG